MKKMFDFFRNLLSVLLVIGLSFGAGYCLKGYMGEGVIVEESNTGFDFELPGEVERRVLTVEEVETYLIELGQFSTYSGEYTYTLGKEETRYVLEKLPVPGTKNSIEITCNGVVKVGYNIADIGVKVDDGKIHIAVPEAQINDNYVIWDSIECKESNKILNPIEFSQYEEIIMEIEQKGLENVMDQGIMQSAEENLKVLIKAFLSEFDDYEIVFV